MSESKVIIDLQINEDWFRDINKKIEELKTLIKNPKFDLVNRDLVDDSPIGDGIIDLLKNPMSGRLKQTLERLLEDYNRNGCLSSFSVSNLRTMKGLDEHIKTFRYVGMKTLNEYNELRNINK
jgi:hypothetical protein